MWRFSSFPLDIRKKQTCLMLLTRNYRFSLGFSHGLRSFSLFKRKKPKKSIYPEKSLNGKYDYDLIVIGGGSGGLAASKQAMAENPNLKVACFDFVKPTPAGTQWGLGGTCVNVGCIPKKLMHYTSLLGESLEGAKSLGWNTSCGEGNIEHNWSYMVKTIDNYIKQLNFGYVNSLRDSRVEYINAYAKFLDSQTIVYHDNSNNKHKKKKHMLTAEKFIIATGGRPVYPPIPGIEYAITSDDIFQKKEHPKKTLVVGASYISLECAGFMNGLGADVTVAVRSILLRGFDQQIAEQIGEHMERNGVRFLGTTVVSKIERISQSEDGPVTVTLLNTESGNESQEQFDTVLFAIGRKAVTSIGLKKAGVSKKKGKIVIDDQETTNVPHIYAIGDCVDRPELTPVAIQAGKMLAKRLYGKSNKKMDYGFIPTTVFTPLEYGTCGMSQEEAEEKIGKENVTVFLSRYGALESATTEIEYTKPRSKIFHGDALWSRKYALTHNKTSKSEEDKSEYEIVSHAKDYTKQPLLAKLVCDSSKNNKVIGFHYAGPNAGEMTQGFALALKLGVTKEDFDDLVGIHPTTAEEFTSIQTTLSSGDDFMKKGGC